MDPQDARVVGSKERTEAPLELNLDDPIVFDMEILEDIPAELQAFVRLSRLDLFQEASDWFEKCLSRHRHMFPVFTEYADMLLQQGSYSELVKVLDDMDIKYLTALGSTDPADVSQLFRVMKTLAIVRWRGISEGELSDAMRCWDYLKERYTDKAGQDEEPNGVQIRIVEIYLSIVVAILESNLHEGMDKYTNPPWTSPKSPKWLGFCAWYTTLKQNGFHWEAQKIQSILLPIVGLEDAMKTFIRKDQFTAVADDIKAGRFDESLVLTELVISNNICNYLVELHPRLIVLAEAYLDAARSLKAWLSQNSRLDRIEHGRPLLQVDELDEVVNRVRQSS